MTRRLAALALLALPAAAEEPTIPDLHYATNPPVLFPELFGRPWLKRTECGFIDVRFFAVDLPEQNVRGEWISVELPFQEKARSLSTAEPAPAQTLPLKEERTYRFIKDPRELDAFGPQNSYAPGPATGGTKGTLSLDDLPSASGRPREGLGKLFEDPQNLETKRREGTVHYYDLDGDGRLDSYESDTSTQIGPLEFKVKGSGDSAGFDPIKTILPIRPRD